MMRNTTFEVMFVMLPEAFTGMSVGVEMKALQARATPAVMPTFVAKLLKSSDPVDDKKQLAPS